MGKLRLVFSDHLSLDVSSLQDVDKQNDAILFIETTDYYASSHRKKLCL